MNANDYSCSLLYLFQRQLGCGSQSLSKFYSKDRSITLYLTRTRNVYQFGNHFKLRVRTFSKSTVSRIVRKPDSCLYQNKGADQLRSNCEAHQRLCFRYTDRYIVSTHKHLHTQQFHHTCTHIPTKVLWRWASGEAAGVGHTGSCSCRPARRRLSSIWSFSVRRSSKRNSAVG